MAYMQFELSDATIKRINTKLAEYQETLITDEMIQEAFSSTVKNILNQAMHEAVQTSALKKVLVAKAVKLLSENIKDLDKV